MKYVRQKIRWLLSIMPYPVRRIISKIPLPRRSLCIILKSQIEIEKCSRDLLLRGFVSHAHKCKNWDLAHIIPAIKNGNFLDLGSCESYILKNLSIKGILGELHGIDLRNPDVVVQGVKYSVGDLMNTRLQTNYFKNITCLSVIEHDVDLDKFLREASRLLQDKGKLFVTFDYWEPKITPSLKLYDLKWQILDKKTCEDLIAKAEHYNLYPVQEMDWTIGEAVIKDGYYSPDPQLSYTFGLLTFEKRF